MCLQPIELYSCAATKHKCVRLISEVGTLPNGKESEGEPHPHPEDKIIQPCGEAMRIGLNSRDIQKGLCPRGLWSNNKESTVPDPNERPCAEHKLEELRRKEDEARIEREEFEAKLRKRRDSGASNPSEPIKGDPPSSKITTPTGKAVPQPHSCLPPSRVPRSRSPSLKIFDSGPSKPIKTSSSKMVIKDPAGDPKKNIKATVAGSSAPPSASTSVSMTMSTYTPSKPGVGPKPEEPPTTAINPASLPRKDLTGPAAAPVLPTSVPMRSGGSCKAKEPMKASGGPTGIPKQPLDQVKYTNKGGTATSGGDSKFGIGLSKGMPNHG